MIWVDFLSQTPCSDVKARHLFEEMFFLQSKCDNNGSVGNGNEKMIIFSA